MASSSKEFKFESLQDGESIVRYLQALADGFATGELQLSTGEHQLQLHPQGLLRFRLQAKRGKEQGRLVLKVSWREIPLDDDDARDSLHITPGTQVE
jgi:amphi-Trp domain-containing protein